MDLSFRYLLCLYEIVHDTPAPVEVAAQSFRWLKIYLNENLLLHGFAIRCQPISERQQEKERKHFLNKSGYLYELFSHVLSLWQRPVLDSILTLSFMARQVDTVQFNRSSQINYTF